MLKHKKQLTVSHTMRQKGINLFPTHYPYSMGAAPSPDYSMLFISNAVSACFFTEDKLSITSK